MVSDKLSDPLPASGITPFSFPVRDTIAQAQDMDIKRLITQFTYHVEAKPEGGFIARAADPTLPPLEAPTRMELNEKVRQNINAAMVAEFPQLRIPLEQNQHSLSFHIERKPDGGFLIHSADSNSPATDAAPHEIENNFVEKLLTFAGKHMMPVEFSEALAANLSSGNVKVFVTKSTSTKALFSATGSGLEDMTAPPQAGNYVGDNVSSQAPSLASSSQTGDEGSPIHRTGSGNWGIIRFLITLLIIGAIMYFYTRLR